MKVYPTSIPSSGQPGASSITRSERDVFKLFKQIDLADSTAIHSLRFLNAGARPFGQADFVVVSPKGIVVFEVKGGPIRKTEEGLWIIGSEDGKHYTTHESPLEQAARNSMAIRDWLTTRVNFEVKDIPFGHAIVLPYQGGIVKGLDVVSQILADQKNCADPNSFTRWVSGCLEYWWRKKGFSIDALSGSDVTQVVDLLRGKFEVEPSMDARTGAILELQDTLSPEQVRVLDAADAVPRIVVTGGAGSGKSFVIRTLARRYLEQGISVGILIPRKELKNLYPGFEKLGGKLFTGPTAHDPVEVLLVDEGQDFCNEQGTALIDQCVVGGLEAGKWRIFLDDNIQASLRDLWNHSDFELLKLFASGVVLRLDDNYRNTDKIVANILLAVPARIGRAQVSAGADCQQFDDSADRIVKVVNRLHDGGAHWEQICVVVVGDASDVHRVLAASNIKWTSDALGDGVLVANPEYVQGLEFPHVVVYFDGSRELKSAARFYVAASRARVSLAIVDPQGVYTKLVEENLQ